MRFSPFAIVILIAALLQSVLDNVLSPDFRPDIFVVALLFFAVNAEGNAAILASFIIGLAADVVAPAPMFPGPHIISFTIIGSLITYARSVFTLKAYLHIALSVAVVVVLARPFAILLMSFREDVPSGAYFASIWNALATAVVGPYLYSGLTALSGPLGLKRHRFGYRRGL